MSRCSSFGVGVLSSPSPQGLLLVAILGGGDASSTFGGDTAITRTKGYLIFILSFTAMTNSIVGSFSLRFDEDRRPFFSPTEIHRFNIVSHYKIDHGMIDDAPSGTLFTVRRRQIRSYIVCIYSPKRTHMYYMPASRLRTHTEYDVHLSG